MFDIEKIQWLAHINNIPKSAKYWLFDNSSLTAKLKKKYPDFNIELIRQTNKSDYIKREVYLRNGKKPLVYALSIIPQQCLELQNLGTKPLGEILFHNGKRLEIKITQHHGVWARKSIFDFSGSKIIVCEFFLSEIFK